LFCASSATGLRGNQVEHALVGQREGRLFAGQLFEHRGGLPVIRLTAAEVGIQQAVGERVTGVPAVRCLAIFLGQLLKLLRKLFPRQEEGTRAFHPFEQLQRLRITPLRFQHSDLDRLRLQLRPFISSGSHATEGRIGNTQFIVSGPRKRVAPPPVGRIMQERAVPVDPAGVQGDIWHAFHAQPVAQTYVAPG